MNENSEMHTQIRLLKLDKEKLDAEIVKVCFFVRQPAGIQPVRRDPLRAVSYK